MRIFAIRDETDKHRSNLAYLFYYKTAKKFYIELPDKADPWTLPMPLDSFLKKRQHSLNAYWSGLWVQQRIPPHERQNIGQILKEHHLSHYNEFSLLMLCMGRCAQDSYYLHEIAPKTLPSEIRSRFVRCIDAIIPLKDNRMLVFFKNGKTRLHNFTAYFNANRQFAALRSPSEMFSAAEILPGGRGVTWGNNLEIPCAYLYKTGESLPLSLEDVKSSIAASVINAADAANLLHCSRQYINELLKQKLLCPIKTFEKNTLLLKSEVLQRRWG